MDAEPGAYVAGDDRCRRHAACRWIVDRGQLMSLTRPDVLADPGRYEPVARRIFETAIAEGRCAELLLSLFAGAGCTIGDEGELRVWWPTAGNEGGEGA
jgi:hypothetical protein